MHHYFIENENIATVNSPTFRVEFNKVDEKHLCAQRLKVGEHITVVDKSKNYFELELTQISLKIIEARISQRKDFIDKKYDLSIFQGISKGSKLDDVLRATTEIGINKFFAISMQRSIAKVKDVAIDKKIERLNSIARSASMQSGRMDIPKVTFINDFSNFIEIAKTLDILFVFWEKAKMTETIESALLNSQDTKSIGILVGPEGGISDDELDELKKLKQTRICTLGQTILRTQTAGIVSTAIVKHLLDAKVNSR